MANSCPICAGLGAGTGNAAGDAAKKFDDLIAALGGANTAGSALQGVLDKLTTAEAATAAAAKLAAETGHKASAWPVMVTSSVTGTDTGISVSQRSG
jgi:hypothetical protein